MFAVGLDVDTQVSIGKGHLFESIGLFAGTPIEIKSTWERNFKLFPVGKILIQGESAGPSYGVQETWGKPF